MLEAEAKVLLEEAFEAEFALLESEFPIYRGGAKGAMKSYAKCKMSSEQLCAKTSGNLYPTAWERFNGLVCVLISNEENHMVLIVGSGCAKVNPAVVELRFSDTDVRMTAWAKEGLIKQHTARKALDACGQALGLAGPFD